MKKKILSLVLAICLLVPCVFMLTACGKDYNKKTMNVSINPEVSFVLNGKNKVVSVLFENEDASTVYANVNFVGMKADAAVEVMIENAVITGHFDFNGEDISISVNGCTQADITKLENLVKNKINNVCSSLGVEVSINIEQFNETAKRQSLIATALLLSPEKSSSELSKMTNKELINLIQEKQEELKGLTYGQIEELRCSLINVENEILKAIKVLRDQIASFEATIQENENFLNSELIPDAIKKTYKEIINRSKSSIQELVKQIDAKLESYEEDKQEAIKNAKDDFSRLKAQLVNQFNTAVSYSQDRLNNHLEAKLSEGKITQAQYDYWKNLTNK